MADEEKDQQEAKGGSKLPWIILIVVVLGGGGAAGFLLMGKGKKAESAATGDKMGPTLSMDTMVVNLDEPGGTRYLKVALEIELKENLTEVEKKMMPRLRDKLLVNLSSLTVNQVQKTETKLSIKKRIKKMGNAAFGRKIIKAVYFKELVMQ
jgi:flagellar protein FliL